MRLLEVVFGLRAALNLAVRVALHASCFAVRPGRIATVAPAAFGDRMRRGGTKERGDRQRRKGSPDPHFPPPLGCVVLSQGRRAAEGRQLGVAHYNLPAKLGLKRAGSAPLSVKQRPTNGQRMPDRGYGRRGEADCFRPVIAAHDASGRHSGRTIAALEANAIALKIDPYNNGIVGNQGLLLLLTGRPEEALPVLDRAIALDSRSDEVNANCVPWLLGRPSTRQVPCSQCRSLETPLVCPEEGSS